MFAANKAAIKVKGWQASTPCRAPHRYLRRWILMKVTLKGHGRIHFGKNDMFPFWKPVGEEFILLAMVIPASLAKPPEHTFVLKNSPNTVMCFSNTRSVESVTTDYTRFWFDVYFFAPDHLDCSSYCHLHRHCNHIHMCPLYPSLQWDRKATMTLLFSFPLWIIKCEKSQMSSFHLTWAKLDTLWFSGSGGYWCSPHSPIRGRGN